MPSARRPRYVLRRVVVGTLAAALLAVAVYVPVTLLAPLPAAVASIEVPGVASAPAAVLALPAAGSGAIALVDSTDPTSAPRILGTSGAPGAVPIASVTKVITALVTLDAMPLAPGEEGPPITMTAADVEILSQTRAVGGSYELVNEGQVLSERDVLDIMLLESANNYAETLTNWAFGSLADYLDAAKAYLAAHSLDDTTIVDASGLNPGSVSSTTDLIDVATLALADPVLAEIVSTQAEEVPDLGTIDNSNKLLGVDGIDGIKTGTTDEAGSCLLFSADFSVDEKTFSVVGVVLGAESSEAARAAVTSLLDSAKSGFTTIPLVAEGTSFGTYSTAWGETSDIVAAADASALVYSDAAVTATSTTSPLVLGKAGTDVGDLAFTVDGQSVTVDLELATPLTDPGAWWRLMNPGAVFG